MLEHDADALRRLADETLQHLRHERDLVTQICMRATALREMLLKRDNEAVQAEVANLKPLQQQSQRLTAYRQHLTQAIAIRLALPTDRATVSQLARVVDADQRSSLLELKDDLVKLTREANRLHRGNLSIASCFSQFADMLLEALTGETIVKRYAKSGRLDTHRSTPMFQTDV